MIALIGAGTIGSIVAYVLTNSKIPLKIGDKYGNALTSYKNLPNVQCSEVDITNHNQLVDFLKGSKVLINCSPYIFNLQLMESALSAGVNYIDLGGLFHETIKQLKFHDKFKEAGLLAILGLGSTPGTTNVMAAWTAKRMEEVKSVSILCGGVEESSSNSFSFPYSLDTILDELTKDAPILKNGKMEMAHPLTISEDITFPAPIGKMTVYATIHSEQATLPVFLKDKKIEELSFKFALPAQSFAAIKALLDLGLASEEGRKFLRKQIYEVRRNKQPTPNKPADNANKTPAKEWETIKVVTEGTEDNTPTKYTLEVTVTPNDPQNGFSPAAWHTALPSCIAAKWILDGSLNLKGVLPPEQAIEPSRFFNELASYNLRINCHKEFPLYNK